MKAYIVFNFFCMLNAATKYAFGKNQDYIFDVDVECGPNGYDDALVSVLSDVGLIPKVICSEDTSHEMSSTDGVHFTLPVSYPGRGGSPCIFQGVDDGIYNLKVTLEGSEQLPRELVKEYGIFCNVTSGGVKESTFLLEMTSTTEPTSTTEKPVEQEETDKELKAFEQGDITLDMRVMNVLRQDITGRRLRDRKLIWLKLKRPDEAGLLPLKPLSCDIVGNERVAFLREGCGTGEPGALGLYQGFHILGLNVTSPNFRVSTTMDSAVHNFRCSFRRCNGQCDGNSCKRPRRKRSLEFDRFRTEESVPFYVPQESKRSPLEQRLDAFLRNRNQA